MFYWNRLEGRLRYVLEVVLESILSFVPGFLCLNRFNLGIRWDFSWLSTVVTQMRPLVYPKSPPLSCTDQVTSWYTACLFFLRHYNYLPPEIQAILIITLTLLLIKIIMLTLYLGVVSTYPLSLWKWNYPVEIREPSLVVVLLIFTQNYKGQLPQPAPPYLPPTN